MRSGPSKYPILSVGFVEVLYSLGNVWSLDQVLLNLKPNIQTVIVLRQFSYILTEAK